MTNKSIAVDSDVKQAIIDSAAKAGLTAKDYLERLVNNGLETPAASAVAPRFKPVCIWNYATYKPAEKDVYDNVTKWEAPDYSCPVRAFEPTMTTDKLLSKGCPLCLRFIKVKAKAAKRQTTSTYGSNRYQGNRSTNIDFNSGRNPGLSYDEMRRLGGY